MDEDLLIPGLITMIDYVHGIERNGRSLGAEVSRDQALADFYVKHWGGVLGMTPRTDRAQLALEQAIIPWTQALEVFRTKYIQSLRSDGR